MTAERVKRFVDDGSGGVIIPADGSAPHRLDGQPLNDLDRAMLAGKDPLDILEAQLAEKNRTVPKAA